MKGQAINISWLVGTAVFLSALVFSITYTFNNYTAEQSGADLEEQVTNIRQNINEYALVEIRRTPLIVKGPELNSRLPVRERYIFSAETEDVTFDNPNEINMSSNTVRSTVNTSVKRSIMTQFYSGIETETYSSDVSGGSMLSNSKIEVDPGGDGVGQISFESNNLMRNESTFSSSNFTVVTHDIYGETLGGDLEIYDESSEIVLNTPMTNNYYFKNFTELYWRNGSHTDTLVGEGDFRSGNTNGLVLQGLEGSDLGATFVGSLNAEVSKPDNRTVNVSIDSESYRLYLFNDSIEEGKDRIRLEENGGMFFGAAKQFTTLSVEDINSMNDWDESQTESNLGIDGIGYNITIDEEAGSTETSTVETTSEWYEGSFKATTPERNSKLRLGYRNNLDTLVGFWRFDAASDTLSGSSEVRDYSDYDNHGEFSSGAEGDERSAEGTFNSSAFQFDGEDDYVNISDSAPLNPDQHIALSAWIKPKEDVESGIIQRYSGDESSYELSQFDNGEVGLGLNVNQSEEEICYSGENEISLNEWNHVTAVYDPEIGPDDLEIYVDGQQVNTCPYSEEIIDLTGNPRILIGNDKLEERSFNGSIDEVKIYNYSISSQKIDELSMFRETGKYRGNYTSKTIDFGERVTWDNLEYKASLNSETDLKVRFESVNPAGNVIDSSTFDLADGENQKNLDVNGQHQARITVFGSSENATKSWKLDSFTINYDDQTDKVSLGFDIPFQDVTISRKSHAGVENNGEIIRLQDRVSVWR